MSRPQFRKQDPDSFRVNSQNFLPRFSSQTGRRVTISGSSAACARHYMRKVRSQFLQEQAEQIVARQGLPLTPEALDGVRLKLEAEIRRNSLPASARRVRAAMRKIR